MKLKDLSRELTDEETTELTEKVKKEVIDFSKKMFEIADEYNQIALSVMTFGIKMLSEANKQSVMYAIGKTIEGIMADDE